MYEHTTTLRVRYAETDQMDIVYYGNYAQYFEVGRAESIRGLGFSYKDMEAMGVRMPVVEMQAQFLRPAHYDDLISIKTQLRELPEKHQIEFHHEVYNERKKTTHCRASSSFLYGYSNQKKGSNASTIQIEAGTILLN